MKIAIAGAGLTGLTAGYFLSKQNHRVTVFEKESRFGGLAQSFHQPEWDWWLEKYPHHLFTNDQAAIKLIDSLGLNSQLKFYSGRSAYFYKGQIHQFDSPTSILNSKLISWPQKIRVGLTGLTIKSGTDWKPLASQTAKEWSQKVFGNQAASILWQPLLEKKFGPFANQVNAAWLWGRIKKRSFKLGYPQAGLETVINKLVAEIINHHGKVKTDQPIKKLAELVKTFDRVLVTTPTETFLKMSRGLEISSRFKSGFPPHVGSLCFVLALKKPFLPQKIYWLNITDPGIPFVFLDEHTNLVDTKPYGGQHLVYLGGYYPHDHPFFKQTPTKILNQLLPHLKKINPSFETSQIISQHFTRNKYSQPAYPPNSLERIPPFETGVPNLFLSNLDQIFPWDRGINYAIQAGEKAAEKIHQTK